MTTPNEHNASGSASTEAANSILRPFRYTVFTVLWIATVVSNVGTWMQNAAAGWLMTGLSPDPLIVALVQVATSLPMFLFAMPAGALADVVDRRRLLIAMQVISTVIIVILSWLVWADRVTPAVLLVFTFLVGATAAMIAPAWQAIVPQLVPRDELTPAVALNSVGLNVSRAVGPALAGLIIGAMGLAAPFWLNALSNLGVIAALLWWRQTATSAQPLPAEHIGAAVRTGLRHARHNPHLRATLIRATGFFVSASAYWALLPLVARNQVAGGPELYGILLGAIGVGAVGGAFVLPRLKALLGPDRLVAAGSIGTAVALLLFGIARSPATAICASVVAGISWIAVLAIVNVSAQVALPAWVRARGLAVFVTVQFGAMTLGSVLWGQVGAIFGLDTAHFAAAAALLLAIAPLRRWKLQTGAGADLSPSMHWPVPILAREIEHDRGPVLITVEYRVGPENRSAFMQALERFAPERRRDGAYDWSVYQDAADEARFVESFKVDSWLEHLRQHQRVTHADRILQEAVLRFQTEGAPDVRHMIAVTSGDVSTRREDT